MTIVTEDARERPPSRRTRRVNDDDSCAPRGNSRHGGYTRWRPGGLVTTLPIMARLLSGMLLLLTLGCDTVDTARATDGEDRTETLATRPAAPPTASPAATPVATDGSDDGATRVRQRTMKRSGGVYDLTFDNLEFDIQPDQDFRRDMLTPSIEELDGKSVIIRGFIFDGSIFSRRGIKQFVLVRDNQSCCFGPGAKIYHNIMVEMQPNKSTDFTIRPVQVEGRFSIRPWVNPGDGKTYSVFHLLAKAVK